MANDDQERFVPIEVKSLLPWEENREDPVNQRPSICKVPSILRDLSPDSFKPQLVSIGPLHKEDPNVQDIARLKKSYLNDLLNGSTSPPKQPKTKLEECLEKVKASISEIKSSYSATKYSEDELANMMVMDACFILEFCWKYYYKKPTLLSKTEMTRITVDLMLLENQIPFFVLQYIFDLTKPDSTSLSLTCLLHKVLLKGVHPFKNSPNTKLPNEFSVSNLKISYPAHVLDCLHKIYQFESENVEFTDSYHSVVDLERSGVNFEPQENKNKSMAMEFEKAPSCVFGFWRKPTLLMPRLIIQDYTEVVFRNFIAYEQIFLKENYFFTSYSCFMDKLINNREDVSRLVESGVMKNNLGSHKEAATVINRICKNINVDELYYKKVARELHEYYDSFWPNSFANLRRTYFNNPWSVIALLGAITLFVLTAVQTIYTIMSYYP